ncbi:MAG: PfkB family carbohydrate kinase, partial [Candidatus Limnocylindria bacterium]
VVHATRAAAAAGWRVATITAAGPEPEAVVAVGELATLGPSRVTPVESSIRFAIHEEGRGRQLVLESRGGGLHVSAARVKAIAPRAVLLAPIAGELSASAVRACASVPIRVAALQGWLRHLVPGDEAHPLALVALGEKLSAALGELDALVASNEDLARVAPRPREQLEGLRAHLGPRPLLVVTAGSDGAWLDDPANGIRHLPVARRLAEAPTIGAGDAFAGLLALGLAHGRDLLAATSAAMSGAVDYLASRS